MSLRKSSPLLSRRAILIGGVASAGMLAGCSLQPVYGPGGGVAGGSAVSTSLTNLFVELPQNRVEQEIYNALLFAFGQNPATGEAAASHLLNLTTNASAQGTLIARTGETNAKILTMKTTFFVRSSTEERPLLRGSAQTTVPFDSPVNQQFADQRAELDAENRAAHEVARQITAQVSGYFAAGS